MSPESRIPEHVKQIETARLANNWQERLNTALDTFFKQETITQNAFIDLLWENGILDRIAPTDVDEQQARYDLGKAVWEGNRDDAALYVRIMYSAASSLHALRRNYTIAASSQSLINPVFQSTYRTMYEPMHRAQLFPDTDNPIVTVVEEVMKRAAAEISIHDASLPTEIIPLGARGSWNGIDFEVERYGDNGLIWPRVDNPSDHMKLYKLGADRGIPPEELDPATFTT